MSDALLFPGPAGMLGAAAVKVALASGVNGNCALLFGRMCSFNGKPFWELRCKLASFFGVSKRTVTRYFAELVDAALIVNKPAPIGAIHPGCKKELPFRPWYKWAIGLPQIRESVRVGSKDAYERWRTAFQANRQDRATRAKLGAILGCIISKRTVGDQRRSSPQAIDSQPPRHWTADEIEAEVKRRELATDTVHRDTS